MDVSVELARHKSLQVYKPRVGDFILYNGWFIRWCAVVTQFDDKDDVTVIKEGLPFLLFNMAEPNYGPNSMDLKVSKIKRALAGAYSILQDGVWYV